MSSPAVEVDHLRELRARSYREDGVFRTARGDLAVLAAEEAAEVNARNFHDLSLPDKLADLLRGREGEPVSWKEVRTGWISQLRRLSDARGMEALADRMASLLEARLDRPLDLVWAAQEVCTQALVPLVIEGLSAREFRRVLRDQRFKLSRLLTVEPPHEGFWHTVRAVWIQAACGLVVRRELGGRAKGKRPRRPDLTDPVVDQLAELGMDRAVDSVTSVLTAIAGPPGSAAASLALELVFQPEWAERLRAELRALEPRALYASATHAAPLTHRFVKEVLRFWSPPLLMTRAARTELVLGKERLKVDDRYFVSTYLIHHDRRYWQDPDTFDPDRWLAGAPHGPRSACHYVPFGWAPTTCVGAGLGTAQLILLCHLLLTKYRIEVENPEQVRIALAAIPLPLRFRGRIVRRGSTTRNSLSGSRFPLPRE